MWWMHNVMLTQNITITREYTNCIMQYPAIKVSAKVFRLPRFFYYNGEYVFKTYVNLKYLRIF
jgi:hypothetical protein